jgi:hypothetical protein
MRWIENSWKAARHKKHPLQEWLAGHPAVDDEVPIRVNQLITVAIIRLHAFSECFQMAAEVVGQNFSVGIRM